MTAWLYVYPKADEGWKGLRFGVRFGRGKPGFAERNQGTSGIPKQYFYLLPFRLVTLYVPKRAVMSE